MNQRKKIFTFSLNTEWAEISLPFLSLHTSPYFQVPLGCGSSAQPLSWSGLIKVAHQQGFGPPQLSGSTLAPEASWTSKDLSFLLSGAKGDASWCVDPLKTSLTFSSLVMKGSCLRGTLGHTPILLSSESQS